MVTTQTKTILNLSKPTLHYIMRCVVMLYGHDSPLPASTRKQSMAGSALRPIPNGLDLTNTKRRRKEALRSFGSAFDKNHLNYGSQSTHSSSSDTGPPALPKGSCSFIHFIFLHGSYPLYDKAEPCHPLPHHPPCFQLHIIGILIDAAEDFAIPDRC